jgi:hypothetical protein
MKKIIAILAVLMLLQLAVADIVTYNTSENETNNETSEENTTEPENVTGLQLPEINKTEVEEKIGNVTETGIGPVDQITNFLVDASPFLLLVIGILLIVLSGFGKIIGIILVILALLRFAWMFL